jgi:Icc-related predicted phosphoesterase
MKVLHVADLHLQHDWFDWVSSRGAGSEFDLIIIAGDLQDAFSNTPMHDQARAISTWLVGLRTPTVVCSGNHDYWVDPARTVDTDADAAWIRRLRGKGNIIGVNGDIIDFHGLCIAVNGWLQVPDIDHLIDILVTHAPPVGCVCAGGAEGRDVGDPELWDTLKYNSPKLMLCGHVHQPRRTWCWWPPPDDPTTLVLVPGCDEGAKVPAHWIIDTDKRIATHNSGTELEYGILSE